MVKFNNRLPDGLPEMDTKHNELIEVASDVFKVYKTRVEASVVLQCLAAYVIKHCNSYEQLQHDYSHPNFANHCEIHKSVERDFISSYHDIKHTDMTTAPRVPLNNLTANWIGKHFPIQRRANAILES